MKPLMLYLLAVLAFGYVAPGATRPLQAQEEDAAPGWWESEDVPRDFQPGYFQYERKLKRSTRADDLRVAKALAEHDWPAFLALVEPPAGLLERLRKGEDAALYETGLASLYGLCEDETVKEVFPARVSSRYGEWDAVVLYGVTEGRWLRSAGGLCAFKENRPELFVPPEDDTITPVGGYETREVDASPRVCERLQDRIDCMDQAPNPFDALTQCGGLVLAKLLARGPEPAEKTSKSEEGDWHIWKLEVLRAAYMRSGAEKPAQPVEIPFNNIMGYRREPWLLYDILHGGERYYPVAIGPPSAVWPDQWSPVEKALVGWSKIKTGDEQIEFLRGLVLSEGGLMSGWSLDALRDAGLGQRPLDAQELKEWMAVVYDDTGWAHRRCELFGTLLRANWNELRGEILPVAERLELDHWWMGEFLKTIARVAPGDDPETEGIMEAVRALRAELD